MIFLPPLDQHHQLRLLIITMTNLMYVSPIYHYLPNSILDYHILPSLCLYYVISNFSICITLTTPSSLSFHIIHNSPTTFKHPLIILIIHFIFHPRALHHLLSHFTTLCLLFPTPPHLHHHDNHHLRSLSMHY